MIHPERARGVFRWLAAAGAGVNRTVSVAVRVGENRNALPAKGKGARRSDTGAAAEPDFLLGSAGEEKVDLFGEKTQSWEEFWTSGGGCGISPAVDNREDPRALQKDG
jgi:hypothetical protein